MRHTYVNTKIGGDEMACVFCGSTATFSAPPGVTNWVCNSCMKHLAGKLHEEEQLCAKNLLDQKGCAKKNVDRSGSGSGRGGA